MDKVFQLFCFLVVLCATVVMLILTSALVISFGESLGWWVSPL